ncbi:MAG: SAM-dependent methyltransferase, partial [Sphingobium sp.]
GAMLAIDYGYAGPATGDTMQAVQAHRFADPFLEPGDRDMTAHVDFTPLGAVARSAGLTVSPLTEQGPFFNRLGMAARAAILADKSPVRREELAIALRRLTDAAEMGQLFKVMGAVNPDWPAPEGFGI